jgi:hypothetical protein
MPRLAGGFPAGGSLIRWSDEELSDKKVWEKLTEMVGGCRALANNSTLLQKRILGYFVDK